MDRVAVVAAVEVKTGPCIRGRYSEGSGMERALGICPEYRIIALAIRELQRKLWIIRDVNTPAQRQIAAVASGAEVPHSGYGESPFPVIDPAIADRSGEIAAGREVCGPAHAARPKH